MDLPRGSDVIGVLRLDGLGCIFDLGYYVLFIQGKE